MFISLLPVDTASSAASHYNHHTFSTMWTVFSLTKSQGQAWDTLIQVVGQGGHTKAPTTTHTIAIALGSPPQLDGKTQFLRTPFTLPSGD